MRDLLTKLSYRIDKEQHVEHRESSTCGQYSHQVVLLWNKQRLLKRYYVCRVAEQIKTNYKHSWQIARK